MIHSLPEASQADSPQLADGMEGFDDLSDRVPANAHHRRLPCHCLPLSDDVHRCATPWPREGGLDQRCNNGGSLVSRTCSRYGDTLPILCFQVIDRRNSAHVDCVYDFAHASRRALISSAGSRHRGCALMLNSPAWRVSLATPAVAI